MIDEVFGREELNRPINSERLNNLFSEENKEMTDLEKEAENFIIERYELDKCYRVDNKETRQYMSNDVHNDYEEEYQCYLTGAEPREKQIAELEKENEEAKDIIEDLITRIPASLDECIRAEKERAEKFLGWE